MVGGAWRRCGGAASQKKVVRDVTDKEVVRWLSRAYWARKRIDKLRLHCEAMRAMAEGVKGMRYDAPRTRGGTPDTIADSVAALLEVEAKLDAEIKKYAAKIEEIDAAIKQVEDSRLATLLLMRYVQGLRWERIAREMSYSWAHVYRLHKAALMEIGKILERDKFVFVKDGTK